MRLKSLIDGITNDQTTTTQQLRAMDTGQLQNVLAKLLRRAGLDEEDIATFIAMDPRKALQLLKGVIGNK